jgi:hypothetical protein
MTNMKSSKKQKAKSTCIYITGSDIDGQSSDSDSESTDASDDNNSDSESESEEIDEEHVLDVEVSPFLQLHD